MPAALLPVTSRRSEPQVAQNAMQGKSARLDLSTMQEFAELLFGFEPYGHSALAVADADRELIALVRVTSGPLHHGAWLRIRAPVRYLVENRNRVISRDRLLEQIWGYDRFVETRSVDVHVGRLRGKR